jgi:hypothetical protein
MAGRESEEIKMNRPDMDIIKWEFETCERSSAKNSKAMFDYILQLEAEKKYTLDEIEAAIKKTSLNSFLKKEFLMRIKKELLS